MIAIAGGLIALGLLLSLFSFIDWSIKFINGKD